jgi:hypothetical protein
MSDQPPTQIASARTVGTVLQATGVLIGTVAVIAAITAAAAGSGPTALTGVAVAVGGLVVYGIGQILWVLAAILLETWTQGED